ncbi:MAG: FMN-binding protein [Clostridium sp.]
MFKKLISLLMLSVLSLTLFACGGDSDTSTTGYKDGTYTAAADPWDFGSEDATVVIKDGKITEVTLRRLDKEGKEVNYDDWQGQTIDGKTYPNLKKDRIDMAQNIIKNQNTKVDTISGATTTTANWKVAVDRALEKSK